MFYLMFLLHLITLPIRICISVLVSPFFKIRYPDIVYPKADSAKILEIASKVPDIDSYGDDKAKFHGMYWGCSDNYSELNPSAYISNNTFVRSDNMSETSPTFSGDMLSGVLYGLYLKNGLFYTYKDKLKNTILNICNNKIPLKISHPNPYSDSNDRGWIFRPWGLGSDLIQTNVFMDWVTGICYDNLKLKTWTNLLYYSSIPLMMFPDLNILFGKVYLCYWNTPHSTMLYCCAGYERTNKWVYKYAAKKLYMRYGKVNPEIAILYYHHIDKSEGESLLNRVAFQIVEQKGTHIYIPKGRMLSLRNFKFKNFESYPLTLKCLGKRHVWEENILEPRTCNNDRREKQCLDSVFSAKLLLKYL